MQLDHLSDESLLEDTERLVREERERLIVVLHHFREIERRRLYSALEYSSLFQYAVKRLRYSEDQAQRRVGAARLLKELPETEEKIKSGALTLTNISLARVVFRAQKLNRDQKIQLLGRLENKTKREASVILAGLYPLAERPDTVRTVTGESVELRFWARKILLDKIEILKGRIAHKHSVLPLGEFFELLCDQQLSVINKPGPGRDGLRQIRASIRAQGKCSRCQSTYALEIDHRQPKALGGTDAKENLRLLCRSCNQRVGIEALGQAKMDLYL